MAGARWLPTLLLLLAIGLPGGMSTCSLHGPLVMIERQLWNYDQDNSSCATKVGTEWVHFSLGETKSILSGPQRCAKFTCGPKTPGGPPELYVNEIESGCVFNGTCTREVVTVKSQSCETTYSCHIFSVGVSINTVSGLLAFSSWYDCQTSDKPNSGPCMDKCFNPWYEKVAVDQICIPKGGNFTTRDGEEFICTEGRTCDPSDSYIYMEASSGCSYNGESLAVNQVVRAGCENIRCTSGRVLSTTPAGCDVNGACYEDGETVHSEGACKKTTCHLDWTTRQYNLTETTEGCEMDGKCLKEGETHTEDCKESTCTKDSGTGEFRMVLQKYTGCDVNGTCYEDGETVHSEGACKKTTCHLDWTTRQYNLTETTEGCEMDGKCLKEGETHTEDCKESTCTKDSWTGEFRLVLQGYTGCFDPRTNRCSHKNWKSYVLNGCIRNRCNVAKHGKWKTYYRRTRKCKPRQRKRCETHGLRGCEHKGQCYPRNSVITWDDCTQYVCYSADADADLNSGTRSQGVSPPKWEPRATGCYGPLGCMKLGEEFVDPNTRNTYRCTNKVGGLGYKFPHFYKSCVAPDGTMLAFGESVLVGKLSYSCYSRGRLGTPVASELKEKAYDDTVRGD
ncbi:uncharacterized protein LOC143294987 isoform X2 [Babylonia areolata]|uniref:uncharacterized protein LOC143294987 isoform X2 n=1 Tax=Babylonia areolata TaxID=304850 RepID=UPI003FD20F3B